MSILIDENTKFIIQGITGKQGTRSTIDMLASGSKLVAGVTPGKGGQQVEGVPVFNSIKEAQEIVGEINCSVVMVPPRFAKGAVVEAIEAGILLINIITENIPIHDMAECLKLAKEKNVRIIGATSAGIYSVGKSKCGPVASGKSKIALSKGSVGIISRSGGMSCETALVLTQAELGQSTIVSIGSDVLMGSTFKEIVELFENDSETKGIVLFGEIGGTSEEDLAEWLLKRRELGNLFTKPIVAFISGKFAENLGVQNVSLGHAGAIIEGTKGTREGKVKALKEAGVIIAEYHHKVAELMKKELELKNN
ncbi:succinate--CoA ligase subunit alpha [archaeon]|jgi:succinyl-CoA synthetase alpha subunit|nr:succinate--CoA ligase subunit alpha [archaeon]MBT6761802.1 succinate--CoA ligase subunit alpha [archaeon]